MFLTNIKVNVQIKETTTYSSSIRFGGVAPKIFDNITMRDASFHIEMFEGRSTTSGPYFVFGIIGSAVYSNAVVVVERCILTTDVVARSGQSADSVAAFLVVEVLGSSQILLNSVSFS